MGISFLNMGHFHLLHTLHICTFDCQTYIKRLPEWMLLINIFLYWPTNTYELWIRVQCSQNGDKFKFLWEQRSKRKEAAMKFSLQSRQVNCSDLLRLASQHEAGSLALETVIIEVRAWQVQGRVEHRVGGDRGLQHCKCIESPPAGFCSFHRQEWTSGDHYRQFHSPLLVIHYAAFVMVHGFVWLSG